MMSPTNSANRALPDFSPEVEDREHKEIAKRRRHVLKMHLDDPKLPERIDQLAIDEKLREALTEYLNIFHNATVAPSANQSAVAKDPLSNFIDNVRKLTSSIPDSDQALVKDLFGEVLFEQEAQAPNTVGLALSGGGIRSASFNLGVLQAISKEKFLKCIDYLSTVSGGGYIGSSLTWFLQQQTGEEFPFTRDDRGRRRVEWIRRHASYLTPGDGLNVLALAAAALRGILINLLILVPLWLLIVWVLTLGLPVAENEQGTFSTSALLKLFGRNHLSVVVAMFVSMVLVGLFRRSVDPETGNDLEDDLEDWPMRLLLWLIVGVAAFQIAGVGLAKPWTAYSDYFLVLPPMVVVLVVFIGTRISPQEAILPTTISPRKAILSKARITELFEIASWAIVFWMLYIFVPAALFENDLPLIKHYPPAFVFILAVGVIVLFKLLVDYIFFTVLSISKARLRFLGHRYFSVQYGVLLGIAAFCVIVGLIPLVDYCLVVYESWLKDQAGKILASMSIGGVISTVLGWLNRGRTDERRGYVALLLRAGLVLLITSAVLVTYRWAASSHSGATDLNWWLIVPWIVLFGLVVNADINYVSMHRYYRNRLLEAFLIPEELDRSRSSLAGSKSDNIDLCKIDIGATAAPYHLINTNLVTVGSTDNKLRLRGGDSFIFSPQFIGSKATGWVRSDHPNFEEMNLATALAISGAAVDPNTGATRSWPLRIIMTWLNVRLGFWLENPNDHCASTGLGKIIRESWLWLITKEMFGQPHEKWHSIRLSDGGHFENLGLYELIRRRCSLIVVSDAGADPEFKFSDLALAIERIRVDFPGVEIRNLQTDKITPKSAQPDKQADMKQEANKELRLAELPFIIGEIVYDQEKDERGLLIYVKTTLFPELSEDILGYARQHMTFPDESTADQFFTEEQFEAYRELGYRAMTRAIDKNKDEMCKHMGKYPFFRK